MPLGLLDNEDIQKMGLSDLREKVNAAVNYQIARHYEGIGKFPSDLASIAPFARGANVLKYGISGTVRGVAAGE